MAVLDGWSDLRLSTVTARRGEVVEVVQAGYLTRRQAFDGQPVFLWPAEEPGFVDELVYSGGAMKRWECPRHCLRQDVVARRRGAVGHLCLSCRRDEHKGRDL